MAVTYPLEWPSAFKVVSGTEAYVDWNVTMARSQRRDQFTELNSGSRFMGDFILADFAENSPEHHAWRDFYASIRASHGTFKVPAEIGRTYHPTAYYAREDPLDDGFPEAETPPRPQFPAGTTVLVMGFADGPENNRFVTIDDNLYELRNPRDADLSAVNLGTGGGVVGMVNTLKEYDIEPPLQKDLDVSPTGWVRLVDSQYSKPPNATPTLYQVYRNDASAPYCIARALSITKPTFNRRSRVFSGAAVVWEQDIQ